MDNIVEAISQIDVALARGVPFEAIEEEVDRSSMRDDEKAAAWLYVWSTLHRKARRQMTLGFVEEGR